MMLRATLVLAALLTSGSAMAASAWTGGDDLPDESARLRRGRGDPQGHALQRWHTHQRARP